MTNRSVICWCGVLLAALRLSVPACAEDTAYGHITVLQTGSRGGPAISDLLILRIVADDTMTVNLDVPFVNSANYPPARTLPGVPPPPPCKTITGGYALDPTDPGLKVAESVLLSAYLANKKVSLGLHGCVFDKPKIISVTLSASHD